MRKRHLFPGLLASFLTFIVLLSSSALAAPPADVIAYACALLSVPPPPLISLEQAAKEMSAMAASFWVDNRRVDNTRIKRDLGVRLRYPDYRAGLAAILSATARVESASNS